MPTPGRDKVLPLPPALAPAPAADGETALGLDRSAERDTLRLELGSSERRMLPKRALPHARPRVASRARVETGMFGADVTSDLVVFLTLAVGASAPYAWWVTAMALALAVPYCAAIWGIVAYFGRTGVRQLQAAGGYLILWPASLVLAAAAICGNAASAPTTLAWVVPLLLFGACCMCQSGHGEIQARIVHAFVNEDRCSSTLPALPPRPAARTPPSPSCPHSPLARLPALPPRPAVCRSPRAPRSLTVPSPLC